MNGLAVFLTFFNLSLNFAIRSWWSEPQSALGLVFADCIEFSIFGYKEYNQSDFGIDRLVMSICRVFSCVVGRGCLLWPVRSLGKTLLAFALLHSVLQGQTCLLLQVFLDFLLLHASPLWWKKHLFWVLVREALVFSIELFSFSFFNITGWDIDLNYCDIDRFALEINWDHSFVFEIASKYCLLDLFCWLWCLLQPTANKPNASKVLFLPPPPTPARVYCNYLLN